MNVHDATEQAYRNGYEAGKPKWIPVGEGLPEEFVFVLVCIPAEDPMPTVKEAYLASGVWVTKMTIFFKEDVTHWMPMPEPPEEG